MSEFEEKKAAKNGILTASSLVQRVAGEVAKGRVEGLLVVWMDPDGQIFVGYSYGVPLQYMGMIEVAKNDLLVEVLENQAGG